MRRTLQLAGIAIALLGLFLAVNRATAQDPAQVNPTSVHVELDNAQVRVLESTLAPGQKEKLHSHPACVLYVISGGKIRNHLADGSSSEAKVNAGDVVYRPPVTHWAENIGSTTVHTIIVELKSAGAGAPPATP